MADNQQQQPPAVPTTANGHRERRPWTEDEDRLLREAIAREDPGANPPSKWHAIATHVPNRTNKDCRKRWWAQMATTVAKGGWSAEEDDRLCTAVDEFGTKWALVATRVQTRNSGQCAKRWNDALNPAIDRSEWTDEEDVKLLEAVKTQGKSWTNIVRQLLPGRTGLAAKNRYNHLTRASSDRAQARERRKTAAGPYARGAAGSGAPAASTSSATSVNGSPTSQLSRAHSPRTPPDGYVQPKTEEGQYYRPGDYPSNGGQPQQAQQQTSDERPLSLPHAPYPPPPLAGYPYRVAQPNTPLDSPRSATAAYPPGPYFSHGGPPPAGVYHHSSQPPTPASALGPPGPPYFPSAPPPTGYDARAAAFEHQRRGMQPSPSSAHAYPSDQAGQYAHHPEYRGQPQGQPPAGGYERRYDDGYESVPGVPMQPVANGMVNQSSW